MRVVTETSEISRLIDYNIPFTTDPEDFCDVFDAALLFHFLNKIQVHCCRFI